MAKPIVNYIFPFDASDDKKITFTYSGDLPYYNRLVVYDAETLATVYDNTSYSRTLYVTLPGNTLSNGTKYAAAVQCLDEDNNASSLSDKVYFWCLQAPTFEFSNVSDGDVITSSSFYASVTYQQAQDENLSQFQFFIYDENKTLLLESQIFYSTDYLTFNYSGLSDDTIYYIRAKGLTEYGTELDTGYIKIDVDTDYENPEFNNINAVCNELTGNVTYYTNFTVVNSDEAASNYRFSDSYIDLSEDELNYTTGINLTDDFLLCVKMKEIWDGDHLTLSNGSVDVILSSYTYDNGEFRFRLTVENGLTPYILYSDPYRFNPYYIYTVYIKKVNNVYQLYVFETSVVTINNMYFGEDEPTDSLEYADTWLDTENTPTVEIASDDIHTFIMDDEPSVLAKDLFDIWIGGKDS